MRSLSAALPAVAFVAQPDELGQDFRVVLLEAREIETAAADLMRTQGPEEGCMSLEAAHEVKDEGVGTLGFVFGHRGNGRCDVTISPPSSPARTLPWATPAAKSCRARAAVGRRGPLPRAAARQG